MPVSFAGLSQYDTGWPVEGLGSGTRRRKATRDNVQGMSGMARKATTTSGNLDQEVAKELENALDIDLFVDDSKDGLDMTASMADFEAQISKAAEDLARESRSDQGAKAPAAKTAAPAAAAAAATAAMPAPKPVS